MQQKKPVEPTFAVAVAQAERTFTTIAERDRVNLNFRKEAEFALSIISQSEQLQKCTPQSIRDSVVNVASVGLSLNPALAHAYLIPWRNQCGLMVSYRGLAHLALQAEAVKWVQAEVVYAKDEWIERRGSNPTLQHTPYTGRKSERGEPVRAYCEWRTDSGEYRWETVDIDDLEKARKASKAPDSPAWKIWRDEMFKKVAVKRASKLWHKTPTLANQIAMIHKLDDDGVGDDKPTGNSPEENRTLDGEARVCVSDEQAHAIEKSIDSPELLGKVLEAYNANLVTEIPADCYDEIMERIAAYKQAKPKSRRKAA